MERTHVREPRPSTWLSATIFVSCAVPAILAYHRKDRASRGHWQRSCNLSRHPRNLRGEVEGNMKSQKRIRIQMVLVGLGAALLMAGSARAQQDMDPTYFDIHPGTPAAQKTAVVRRAEDYLSPQADRKAPLSRPAGGPRRGATVWAGEIRRAR